MYYISVIVVSIEIRISDKIPVSIWIILIANRSEEYIFFFTKNGGNNVISTILWSNEVINIINIYTTNMILRLKLLVYIDEMITSLYYKNIIYNHFSA